jgi:hypothetical protein
MNDDVVFLVVSMPHSTTRDSEITGWIGVNNPKETEYHHDILLPTHAADAASTSVFHLLYMALTFPVKHDLPISYAISGKAMGAQVIEVWNMFAGEGDNSHRWLDTPFFHRWVGVMSTCGKQTTLCWEQSQTYDREPPARQGP